MNEIEKLANRPYLFGLFVLFAITVIPIMVNSLMGFGFGNVHGKEDTWIAFFGSYMGAVISGIITILGVYLTIRFTYGQNQKTLEFTKQEARREKLPEMIYNLEECLDFLITCLDTLDELMQVDYYEIAHIPPYKWSLRMFEINDNYEIIGNYKCKQATKEWLKTIRNFSVKADTPAYEAFLELQNTVQEAHIRNISPLQTNFTLFRGDLISVYGKEYPAIISKDFKLSYLELSKKHKQELKSLKVELNHQEGLYLNEIIYAYAEIQEKMKNQLYDLTKEFSTS